VSVAQLDAANRAHTRAQARLRQTLVQRILNLWHGLGSWDRVDIPKFAPRAARLVRAGQLQEGRLMLGYLDRVSRAKTGRKSPTVNVDKVPGRANGADLEDVYTRPFVWTWTDMSNDKPLADAVDMAAYRLERSVQTDLQLAARNTAHAVMDADRRVIGYKRVLSDKPNHCPLCVVASTNKYRKKDLLPIHPACGCTVEPIYLDGSQTEASIDRRVEEALKRAKDQKIVVLDHGEYGPYLQAA
jgi:hypothetical protein